MAIDKNTGMPEGYWEAFKQGQSHAKTAPDTDRRLIAIEQSVKGVPEHMATANLHLEMILNERLPEIKNHVQETVGKVIKNTAWRNYTAGGLAVVTALLVPMLFWSVTTISGMESYIQSEVQEALMTYDFTNG